MKMLIRNERFNKFIQMIIDSIVDLKLAISGKWSNIKSKIGGSIAFIRRIKSVPLLLSFLILVTLIPFFAAIEYSHGMIGEPKSNQGEQRVLVLPVYYPNLYPSTSEIQINQIMEEADSYYKEASYGRTWLQWTVHQWILLDSDIEYYGQESIIGDGIDSFLANKMVVEAVRKVDSAVDFRNFDRLVIFHAGYGEQSTDSMRDSSRTKWLSTCHRSVYILTDDNVMINSVSIVAEFEGVLSQLGALVHELGHDFGADDLYNPDDSSLEELDIEGWCLMSSGNWLDDQRTPCHMCLYSKLDIGFLKESQIVPTQNGTYTFEINAISLDSDGFYGARYYLTDDESVYYLVEARKQDGFDSYLKQAGVLISIINETRKSQEGRVLVVEDSRYPLDQRAYGPGEYFVDNISGFGLSVLNETENGYTIRVSTNSQIEFQRITMIDTYLNNPQTDSGSTITTDNGTIFIAVHGTNNTSGVHHVSVFKSISTGETWQKVFSTPFGVNISNPILIAHRVKLNPWSVLTRDKVYLLCESHYTENHTIEVWDLEENASYNMTDYDVDARNPSCVSSGNRIYLAYEIRNMATSNWVPGSKWIALENGDRFSSLKYNLEYIYNASNPSFTQLSRISGEPEEPYLTYLSGLDGTYTNEVWIRSFDIDNRFLVHESPTNITNPSIAINLDHSLTLVVFENWTYPANQDGVYVVVNITEMNSPKIMKLSNIPLAGAIHKPPLVSWGFNPFGNSGFYIAFQNDSMSCMIIDDNTLEEYQIDSWKPIPFILSTHLRTIRWTSPIICELEPSTCFVHRLEFGENGFYDYTPIWLTNELGVENMINPVMVFLSISLVGLSLLIIATIHLRSDTKFSLRNYSTNIGILVLAAVFGIIVNYFFAYLFGG